jgi:hypothetical protein
LAPRRNHARITIATNRGRRARSPGTATDARERPGGITPGPAAEAGSRGALLHEVTTAKLGEHGRGKPIDNDNIIIKPKQGTSRSYTLDRLKRERPDLFARVKTKEITANAAAIEAGFRKKANAADRKTCVAQDE